MFTKKIAIKIIKSFISDIKAKGYKPTKAILFGSIAKEKSHSLSDIDLALWDEKFEGCRPFDYEPIVRQLTKYPDLELHTFPKNETAEDNPFIGEIEKNGIVIYQE